MKVLVVDDETPIVESVSYNLRKEGYEAITAGSAEECLDLARAEKPDLIILDVMLPSASGFEICRMLRRESDVPIIMLTARSDETDRVVGFELGADDYVSKPFSMRELLARVRTILRRSSGGSPLPNKRRAKVGDLDVDPARYEVTVGAKRVDLSPKEFDLLHFLCLYPGQVMSRQVLLDNVWGEDAYVDDRTVDVHVRWIREKIESDPSNPVRVLTVRGIGYKLNDAQGV
jgi:DNA-binding response OmpR family regulator